MKARGRHRDYGGPEVALNTAVNKRIERLTDVTPVSGRSRRMAKRFTVPRCPISNCLTSARLVDEFDIASDAGGASQFARQCGAGDGRRLTGG
jgi:hypothetical protein